MPAPSAPYVGVKAPAKLTMALFASVVSSTCNESLPGWVTLSVGTSSITFTVIVAKPKLPFLSVVVTVKLSTPFTVFAPCIAPLSILEVRI